MVDILSHAARIRAAQAVTRASGSPIIATKHERPTAKSRVNVEVKTSEAVLASVASDSIPKVESKSNDIDLQKLDFSVFPATAEALTELSKPHRHTDGPGPEIPLPESIKSQNEIKSPFDAKPRETGGCEVASIHEVSSLVDSAVSSLLVNIGHSRGQSSVFIIILKFYGSLHLPKYLYHRLKHPPQLLHSTTLQPVICNLPRYRPPA